MADNALDAQTENQEVEEPTEEELEQFFESYGQETSSDDNSTETEEVEETEDSEEAEEELDTEEEEEFDDEEEDDEEEEFDEEDDDNEADELDDEGVEEESEDDVDDEDTEEEVDEAESYNAQVLARIAEIEAERRLKESEGSDEDEDDDEDDDEEPDVEEETIESAEASLDLEGISISEIIDGLEKQSQRVNGVKVNFDNLLEENPETITAAAIIAKAILAKAKIKTPVPAKPEKTKSSKKKAKAKKEPQVDAQEAELKTLRYEAEMYKAHPDWQEIGNSKEFHTWINKQKNSIIDLVNNGLAEANAKDISLVLEMYKAQGKKKAPAKKKAQQKKVRKKQVLKNTIRKKSNSGTTSKSRGMKRLMTKKNPTDADLNTIFDNIDVNKI